MSIEALNWALTQAPDVPAHCVGTLIGFANHAREDGTAAYPSVPTLGRYARKGDRQIQNDIVKLLELGLIREGDQRFVAHLPSDRRPIVYDLAMERRIDGGVIQPKPVPVSGKAHRTRTAAPHAPAEKPSRRRPKITRTEPQDQRHGGAVLPLDAPRCTVPGHHNHSANACAVCRSEKLGRNR
ncbi:hypothetical protein FHR83_007495 [Actinoplanes campanulatus]|uniref:Helix-turn-helix domain-containing protein n=1 Tax=Actinoplanes campanulatus TaxID=113559 RepID=A0A7W5APW0_9ACTN|nr:hypothetical protein [Actinoplanes campanulatus]MBB3099779.1 hypothetical protein [Actinoplanes campanulatus]GGN47085.1 hypothetical protein GCM10010109_82970 [Actinoplanes campanulatus]GID42348.1 hypothetical protein Aca09nite_88540 [Actinoplanes campanulatus]